MTHVGGIVLCGGRSSRMGRPKAQLLFGSEPMLARVVRTLRAVVEPVIVVAAAEQELPELPSSVLIARDAQAYLGPLNGLVAGLEALAGNAQAAYLSSCDVPFLVPGFVGRVIERLADKMICLPKVDGHKHPLAGVYRLEVLESARSLLARQRLRLFLLSELLPTQVLGRADFADVDPDLRSLRNINSPEEYEAALREC